MLDHHDGMRLEGWGEISVMLANPDIASGAPYIYERALGILDKSRFDRGIAAIDIPHAEVPVVLACSEAIVAERGVTSIRHRVNGVRKAARGMVEVITPYVSSQGERPT